MNICIREYKKSDYSGLIILLKDVYDSEIHQDVLENKYISSTRSIIVAADEDGSIVGCTFVEIQEDYVRPKKIAYVTYVAVDTKSRKQGIGRSLLEFVEKKCREFECSAIELTSANFRTDAHAFYDSLGYSRKKTTIFIKEMK